MPKIERIEGAPMEMKRAATGIVSSFSIAKECPEVRLQEIHKMRINEKYHLKLRAI